MAGLLIGLIVAFVGFSGAGYRYRARLGSAYGRGTSFLGLLVAIFLLLAWLGAIHL